MKPKPIRASLALAALSLACHSPAAEASTPTPLPDLLGHWSFDSDASSSVGGWTGTLQGGAQTGQPGAAVGTGCYRNGEGEGFLLTNLVALQSNVPQSVSLWIKTNSNTGTDEAFFGWGLGGFQNHYDVGLKDRDLFFLLERSSATFPTPVPLNDGQWHHLVISRTASGLNQHTIHLDGKPLGSPSQTFGGGYATPIRIGTGYQRTLISGGPPERDFNGLIDDFAYFNTALTTKDAALIHGLAKLAGADISVLQPARMLALSPAGAVAVIGERDWTKAQGLPGTTGEIGGSLEGGDAWIALDDEGGGIRLLPDEPPPAANPLAIEQLPATITVRSGERASFPFQLRNTGGDPVNWKLKLVDPAGNDNSLDGVSGRFARQSPDLLGSLPKQNDFTGGVTGTQIDSTPFDGGNILKTSLGGPIAYSDGSVAESTALGGDGHYFTLKLPGLFLFVGDVDGPTWFEAGGRTLGYTAAEMEGFDLNHAGRSWKAFAVRRSFSTFGTVVNQLLMVDDASAYPNSLPGYSTTSMNARINFSGKRRICYALFTVAPGGDEKWTAFENLSRTILDLLSDVPSRMTIQPAEGNLTSGGTTSPALEIDTFQLPPGSHALAVDAQPAGGGAEPVRAPCTLVVDEPAIRFASPSIDRAGISGGPSETVEFAIESSIGSELEWTARLLDAGDWVTLLTPTGTTPQAVNLRFVAPASGGSGFYRASLEIRSGNGTYLIPITYIVETWNPTGIFMDPLRDVVYLINGSSSRGVVVAMSPGRRVVRKVFRVSARPSDIAFSPDGSAVYILCASGPDIIRLDAATMEITAKRRVPGTANSQSYTSSFMGRLAVGTNGRVFYTDSSSAPLLRMLDFETGEVLDTLTRTDIPGITSTTTTGFGDVWFDPHGRQLYFTRHGLSSTGYPRIGRIDIDNDQLIFAEEWIAAGSGTIISSLRIFSDLDGRRFITDRMLFERADMNNGRILYDNYVVDISAYGELVLTRSAIHDAVTGQKLADLPVSTGIAAFTSNQAGVLYHAGYGQFEYWPLPAEIRPKPIGIRPEPPNGGAIELGENTLRWSSLPLVDGYRIYLGSDEAAVNAAQPGSDLDQGVVTTNSFTMNPAPTSGTFYWRIDALRGGTVIPGSVHSFSVAPFRVTPREIEVIAPHAALPQRVTLAATDGDGNPVAWSASSTSSWIKFPQPSGTADDPLVVDLDPAGLAPGSHAGVLNVTGSGLTIEIPVSLQLFEVDIYRLRPDPNRPVVYGLQTGAWNGTPGYIIPIDAITGKYIAGIPIEKYATDFAIHPHEDRLYVPLVNDKRIQVFDLKTGGGLPSIELEDPIYRIGSITAGRDGRIYLDIARSSMQFWKPHVIDTSTHEVIGTIDLTSSPYSNAQLASDLSGNNFYWESGRIQHVDISTDMPELLGTGDSTSSRENSWQYPTLVVSHDGGRVLSKQIVLSTDMRRIASIESDGQAITGDGQVVAAPTGLYWADNGFKAANLPVTIASEHMKETLVTFSSDDRFILIWDNANQRVLSFPLASLIDLPGPLPRPGTQLTETPGSLSWGSVSGAMEYQVFLGTNQAAVNSAGIGSNLRIGTSQTNTLGLPDPLAMGYRYYWRVDALTTGGVVKGKVHFFDLPFQSNGNPIIQPGQGSLYGSYFGSSLAPGPDGLLVTQLPGVKWFEFDWTSGTHQFLQEMSINESYFSSEFGEAIAAGPGLLMVGNPKFSEPTSNAGAAFIYRTFSDGQWQRDTILPDPPDGSVSHFGHQLAFDGNQLLIQQGSSWRTSGRVFPYFEWPDWRRGPELVPSPSEQNDFFGAAIAMDGTRALIGAPGSGTTYGRHGSAFIFEYDAPGKRWTQRARLQPSQGRFNDNAGLSLALAGNHAALGSDNQAHAFDPSKVHVFTRRSTGSWLQSATLDDPAPNEDAASGSLFGKALAFSKNILFVSAPYAEWRGQQGGVVYPYRYNGNSWDAMAPIVAPPGGSQFGAAMAVRNGWLFISQYQPYSSSAAGHVRVYRIDEIINRQPMFVTRPPIQVVAGKSTSIEIEANDPDGNARLVFRPADLPPGLMLQDLGNGRARIAGIPNDPAGTERWLRIAVADVQGFEAVQTALVKVLAVDDFPKLGGLPEFVEIKEGEDLYFAPTISGSGPFTWQWRRDDVDLPEATGPSLFIPGAVVGHIGRYSVTVTNAVGSVTSGDINVTVRPADRFAGDWTSFGSASDRDGHQPAMLGRHRFQPVWQTQPVGEPPVNPVAVADGTVFFTERGYHGIMSARAHDLSTGALLWNHVFDYASRVGAPTWHNGRLYIQRSNHSSDSQLWCLDAGTGGPIWSAPFSTQFSGYEAPAVSDIGVFIAGGYGSGIYGHDFDGTRRFFRELPQYDGWTPVISRQRLYTWVEGKFIEHDTQTGLPLWTFDSGWNWQGWSVQTVPVVKGPRAYLLSNSETICIDTDTRQVIWRIPRRFFGTPALAMDRLLVLSGGDVFALSTDDGSELARYATGAPGKRPLHGQPLALNDHLIVTNADNTYVFHIDTAELLQTIPHGGHAAYSAGHLLIAGTDGILRAYFANAAPEFAATMPAAIQANDAADDLILPLGPYAGDVDPDDPLTWAIVSVTRPEVFRTLEIHPQSGDLTVIYNPWESGSTEVVVSVTDSAGNVTGHTITFTVPQNPDPQLELAVSLALNRQTGLYEHAITITHSGAREIAGFDLRIGGLPEGVTVNNASGRDGDDWIIHHRQPLAAGAAVNLVIEYYTPVRGTVLDPQVTVALITEPEGHPDAPEGGLAVERCVVMADGSVMIEFTTTPGALYEIHYSDDAATWKLSPVQVRAAGNRVQWIDSGPPRTATSPLGEKSRFYRVREVPAP